MKRIVLGAGVAVAILFTLTAALLVRVASPTGGTPGDLPDTLAYAGEHDVVEEIAAAERPRRFAPVPLYEASDWPFTQLPLVTKFTAPVPHVALAHAPLSLYEQILTRGIPVTQSAAAGTPLSPWLLLPLAGVALISQGGDDDDGDEERPPPRVVPEPSVLILMSTGLLLVGLAAIYRRAGPSR